MADTLHKSDLRELRKWAKARGWTWYQMAGQWVVVRGPKEYRLETLLPFYLDREREMLAYLREREN